MYRINARNGKIQQSSNSFDPDGISYLDMGDAYLRGDWSMAINGYMADFSVVLLRSDFVLVSEKNHVKMHKNQWLSTPLSPLDIPWRATNRGKHSEGWGADACAVT